MAVVFDAALTRDLQTTGATRTSSFTCTGTNLLLLVGVMTRKTIETITGVTYNGVAMTQLKKVFEGTSDWIYLYGLINPATGANNIVVSIDDSTVLTVTEAASYTGVLQSLPAGTDVISGTGTGATYSPSALTPSVANSWVAGFVINELGATTLTSSGSIRSGSGSAQAFYDTNAVVSSYTAGFSATGSTTWAVVECMVAPHDQPPVSTAGNFSYFM